MATVPDLIVDKLRKFGRDILYFIGAIALLCVLFFYGQGLTGKAWAAGLVALVSLCVAGSLKVTYRLKGGSIEYE